MKKLSYVLSAVLIFAAFLWANPDITDNFPYGDGDLTASGNWTIAPGADHHLNVDTNRVRGDVNFFNNAMYWSANSFNANQSAKLTIVDISGDIGPAVRIKTSGSTLNMYRAVPNVAYFKVVKITDGTETQLGDSHFMTISNGDTITLAVSGTTTTTLTVSINDSPQTPTFEDTTSPHTSGSAGIYAYINAGIADNFIATGEITGAPSHPRFIGLTGVAH